MNHHNPILPRCELDHPDCRKRKSHQVPHSEYPTQFRRGCESCLPMRAKRTTVARSKQREGRVRGLPASKDCSRHWCTRVLSDNLRSRDGNQGTVSIQLGGSVLVKSHGAQTEPCHAVNRFVCRRFAERRSWTFSWSVHPTLANAASRVARSHQSRGAPAPFPCRPASL